MSRGEHGLHADARETAKESSRPRSGRTKPTAMHPAIKGRHEKTRSLHVGRSQWDDLSGTISVSAPCQFGLGKTACGRTTFRCTGSQRRTAHEPADSPRVHWHDDDTDQSGENRSHDTRLTANWHVFHDPAWPSIAVPTRFLSVKNTVCKDLSGRQWPVCRCGCCSTPVPNNHSCFSAHSVLKKKEQ